MTARVEVSITLDTPVEIDSPVTKRRETILSVEWLALGWHDPSGRIHYRLRGMARGNYQVCLTFSVENKPEWAPPPSEEMEAMVTTLLDHERQHGKTVYL